MKTIKFTERKTEKETMADAIINFLTRNGMSNFAAIDYISEEYAGEVLFKPNCANNDYTKAIGLLCLIACENNSPLYIAFRLIGSYGVIRIKLMGNSTLSEAVDYINKYEITIEK